MSTITEAVSEWQHKQISGSELMRAMVSYKNWSLQISEAAAGEALKEGAMPSLMFHQDEQGFSRLSLFSDGAAYTRFCQAAGVTDQAAHMFLTTSGSWVFKLPLNTIDRICIDPGTPPDINYQKEHFPRLRELAEAIEVEESLAALRTGENTTDDMLKQVHDYGGYLIAIHKAEERYTMALAPDTKGRALAAVFTFEDAFDAYYPECKQMYPDGELLLMPMTGAALFAQLQQRDLTGMVFNCAGPGRPIAFAAQFAELVLSAVG